MALIGFQHAELIVSSNFYAVAHPSEPNYCAAAGGDTFGMDNDNFNQIPANVSTVVDLLETRGISWAEYQVRKLSPQNLVYHILTNLTRSILLTPVSRVSTTRTSKPTSLTTFANTTLWSFTTLSFPTTALRATSRTSPTSPTISRRRSFPSGLLSLPT